MTETVNQYLLEGCGRCALGGTPNCKVHRWRTELDMLREIALSVGLEETVKWGVPCYTDSGRNIILISALKEYCAISFFKGVLLDDPKQQLSAPGENSQSARLFRFTDAEQINDHRTDILRFITQSIELERSGATVDFSAKRNLEYPSELIDAFTQTPGLQDAFERLTPGRQRGYVLFFTGAKQSETRVSRIEKSIPNIMKGIGLHDR